MARSSTTLSLAVSDPHWETTVLSMRALPRTLKTEVTRRGRDLAEPLAREIRSVGRGQGSHAARVADTVRSGMKAGIPTVTAGGPPFTMGSEWGGRRRVKPASRGTSPLGRPYVIRNRHTTMQFRQFKGKQGWWFTPTAQDGRGRDAVLKAWGQLVDDVIEDF